MLTEIPNQVSHKKEYMDKSQFIDDINRRYTNKTTICMVIYRGKRQIRTIILNNFFFLFSYVL